MNTTRESNPWVQPVAKWMLVAGTLLCLLGCVIDFVPGSGVGWFVVSGGLAAGGTLCRKFWAQSLALTIIMLSIFAGAQDHRYGLRHQEYLQKHSLLQSQAK